MIACIEHPSPLGTLLLGATERGLCGLYFEQHRHFDGREGWRRIAAGALTTGSSAAGSPAAGSSAHRLLAQAASQLDDYFAGRRRIFSMPLDLAGTAFQRTVWQALQGIPFGARVSYAQLAQKMDRPQALRAVGAAIGKNPLSIIVPCHRVLGASGAMTGYAGGLERKRFLLELEEGSEAADNAG